MGEMSQKMRETVDESTENEKKRDVLFGACHHNLKNISHVASEFDSIVNLSPTSRRCSTFDQWLRWCTFVSHHTGRIELKWHLHKSGNQPADFLTQWLNVDRTPPIYHGPVSSLHHCSTNLSVKIMGSVACGHAHDWVGPCTVVPGTH